MCRGRRHESALGGHHRRPRAWIACIQGGRGPHGRYCGRPGRHGRANRALQLAARPGGGGGGEGEPVKVLRELLPEEGRAEDGVCAMHRRVHWAANFQSLALISASAHCRRIPQKYSRGRRQRDAPRARRGAFDCAERTQARARVVSAGWRGTPSSVTLSAFGIGPASALAEGAAKRCGAYTMATVTVTAIALL